MANNSSRRRYYQSNNKPQWEVDKENAERERLAAIARNLEKTEENFPRLGGGVAKDVSWSGRKFTALASEWKENDDSRKAEEERQKESDCSGGGPRVLTLPKFTPSHHYVEADEGEMTPLPRAPLQKSEDDEWVTVDRTSKYARRQARKQARMEERLRHMDEHADEEPSSDDDNEEDDTCWADGPETHETYWEGRHP